MLGIGLAACSTPESKVRSRLIEVGVSPPMAGCMAERVVDRLSYAQLRRLGELGRIAGDDVRDMRVGELLERTRALQDPEILSVVSRAALGCALSGRSAQVGGPRPEDEGAHPAGVGDEEQSERPTKVHPRTRRDGG